MELSLRIAQDHERTFCESLNRLNMGRYLAARGVAWDPLRFRSSWAEYENLMILRGAQAVGVLRLLPEPGGLGLRDLQIDPEHQGKGIGSWAVWQAQAIAAQRGFSRLQLRVYEDNPAAALYVRLGFSVDSAAHGTLHMTWQVPPSRTLQMWPGDEP